MGTCLRARQNHQPNHEVRQQQPDRQPVRWVTSDHRQARHSEDAAPVIATEATSKKSADANRERTRIPRVVVRYQRKERGGKGVTLIKKCALDDEALRLLCQEIKRALGCGGHTEEDVTVMPGDQRTRLPKLLRAHGISHVNVS